MHHEAVLGSADEVSLHIVGHMQIAVPLTVKIRASRKRISCCITPLGIFGPAVERLNRLSYQQRYFGRAV